VQPEGVALRGLAIQKQRFRRASNSATAHTYRQKREFNTRQSLVLLSEANPCPQAFKVTRQNVLITLQRRNIFTGQLFSKPRGTA